MESELCIAPLHVRRRYLAFRFCLKAMTCTNNITIDTIRDLSDVCQNGYWNDRRKPLLADVIMDVSDIQISSSCPLPMFTLDVWVSKFQLSNALFCNLECIHGAKREYNRDVLRLEVILELEEKYSSSYKIYTDGSKCGDKLGAAFLILLLIKRHNLKFPMDYQLCLQSFVLFLRHCHMPIC